MPKRIPGSTKETQTPSIEQRQAMLDTLKKMNEKDIPLTKADKLAKENEANNIAKRQAELNQEKLANSLQDGSISNEDFNRLMIDFYAGIATENGELSDADKQFIADLTKLYDKPQTVDGQLAQTTEMDKGPAKEDDENIVRSKDEPDHNDIGD